ncbi:hypothetical protein ABT186_37980 [Streptomyces sp. NPDC001634]|uniref:hypothetical protein n=1 Tax=Streptomyces sp. NPDC001634 TaxID=3154390 RepID=UPI00331EB844
MNIRKHVACITVGIGLAGLTTLGMTAPAQAVTDLAATAKTQVHAPQGWKCRETSASVAGATVYATICWKGKTARAAGQVYDTKADRHSGCAEVLKSTSSSLSYCARKGAGTSRHFVTGDFHFSHPVWIRACTEHGPGPGDCSDWH